MDKCTCDCHIQPGMYKAHCSKCCDFHHKPTPTTEDWRREFQQAIKSWIEREGPYWPDWQAVEKFIAQKLEQRTEEVVEAAAEVIDAEEGMMANRGYLKRFKEEVLAKFKGKE